MVSKALPLFLVATLAGCGAAAEPAVTAVDPERSLPEAPPPSGPRTAAPIATPAPARAAEWLGAPLSETVAPGVEPLSTQESAQLQKDCKPFVDALAGKSQKRPKSDPTRIGIALALLEVLQDPPKIAGVDTPTCAGLLRRETVAYVAGMREAQAVGAIKMVLLRLADAEAEGKPCPAAPPVPEKLEQLEAGPYESKRADYERGGWKCLRHDPLGEPQPFQLEVMIEEGKARVVARLLPAGRLTELFVETPMGKGAIDPGATVLRRKQD